MIERRSICLDEDSIKKIRPFVKKHNGNFSSAIRDLIEVGHLIGTFVDDDGDIDEMLLKNIFYRNKYIESGKGVILPLPIFSWILDRCIGELPSLNIIKEVDYDAWKEKALDIPKTSYEELIDMINNMFQHWGWPVSVKIITFDSDKGNLYIEVSGNEFLINRHAAIFLIMNLSLENFQLMKTEELSQKVILSFTAIEGSESSMTLLRAFGENQIFYRNIEHHMTFWKSMVRLFEANDYDLAVINPSALEILLKHNPEQVSPIIRSFKLLFNTDLSEVKLKAFLRSFIDFCEVTKLFKRVEWNDNELIVYHTFSDQNVIDTVKKTLHSLFNETGRRFEIRELDQRFILKRAP
jgi:hypothetical protein